MFNPFNLFNIFMTPDNRTNVEIVSEKLKTIESKFNLSSKYSLASDLKKTLTRCGVNDNKYVNRDEAPIDYYVDFKPCLVEILNRELTTNEIVIIDILSKELLRNDYNLNISS